MLVKTFSAAVNGLEVTTVRIEVSITRGVQYHLTGLGDEAVRESRDRITAALQNNGYIQPVLVYLFACTTILPPRRGSGSKITASTPPSRLA